MVAIRSIFLQREVPYRNQQWRNRSAIMDLKNHLQTMSKCQLPNWCNKSESKVTKSSLAPRWTMTTKHALVLDPIPLNMLGPVHRGVALERDGIAPAFFHPSVAPSKGGHHENQRKHGMAHGDHRFCWGRLVQVVELPEKKNTNGMMSCNNNNSNHNNNNIIIDNNCKKCKVIILGMIIIIVIG